MSLSDQEILALAHRTCAKYVCLQNGGESFSFNDYTMLHFVQQLEKAINKEVVDE